MRGLRFFPKPCAPCVRLFPMGFSMNEHPRNPPRNPPRPADPTVLGDDGERENNRVLRPRKDNGLFRGWGPKLI